MFHYTAIFTLSTYQSKQPSDSLKASDLEKLRQAARELGKEVNAELEINDIWLVNKVLDIEQLT